MPTPGLFAKGCLKGLGATVRFYQQQLVIAQFTQPFYSAQPYPNNGRFLGALVWSLPNDVSNL